MGEIVEEASLLSLLQQIEAAHQQLEDYLAAEMPPVPRRAAAVLMQLRRDLTALNRRATQLWKDAHNADIEKVALDLFGPAGRQLADKMSQRWPDADFPTYLTVVPPQED